MSDETTPPKADAGAPAAHPTPSAKPTPPERPVEGAPGAPALWLPERAFPPYRFVPGHNPHPFMQVGGYAYGEKHAPPPYVEADRWQSNQSYLRGLDFFNRGWWWEAHEEWEASWKVCKGLDEDQYDLLQSLIQLAAAALNLERGHDSAAGRLVKAALGRLGRVIEDAPRLCGLELAMVRDDARRALQAPCPRVEGLYLRAT